MNRTFFGVLALIIVWLNGPQGQNTDNKSIAHVEDLNKKLSAAHRMGRFIEVKTADGDTASDYVAGPSTGKSGCFACSRFFWNY